MSAITDLSDAELTALANEHLANPVYPQGLPAARNPTEDMSPAELALAGAGKAVVDTGRGLKQVGAIVGNKLGLVPDSTVQGIQEDIDASKALDQPLMSSGYGQAGYLGGNLATTMLPVGVAGAGAKVAGLAKTGGFLSSLVNPLTYGKAIGTGALTGMVQPTASDDWGGGAGPLSPRMLNTVTGGIAGAGGNLIANTAGHLAQPFARDPNVDEAVQTLTAAGLPLDLSQRTGNPFLKRVKMAVEDNPITAGGQKVANDARQVAFNRAVLSKAGIDGDYATRDVLGPGKDAISKQFGDVLGRNNVPVTEDFLNQLGSVQAQANLLEKKAPSNVVNHLFDMMLKNGEIKGQDAYAVKKNIDNLLSSSDSTERDLGAQLHDVLMNHMHANMPAEDQAALTQARQQFRVLKTIEPAISKDGQGNISPSLLANAVAQKRNRAASLYGKGSEPFMDLVDLAQSGKQVLPDPVGNSGTFTRGQMDLLPIAKGIVVGLPAQHLLNSGSTYMTHGLEPGVMRDVMESPNTQPLVGGALRRLPGVMPYSPLANGVINQSAPAQ